MIARPPTLADVVGSDVERALASRMKDMLWEAMSKADSPPANAPSPYYPLGVNARDVLGIAAARTLCAAGLFTPDPDQDVGAEVYGFFSITGKGRATVRRRSARRS